MNTCLLSFIQVLAEAFSINLAFKYAWDCFQAIIVIWGALAMAGDEQQKLAARRSILYVYDFFNKHIFVIAMLVGLIILVMGILKSRTKPIQDKSPGSITKNDTSFVNNLGMRFLPVVCGEKTVHFCIHLTRRQDYEAFYNSSPNMGSNAWMNTAYQGVSVGMESDHPVVNVSMLEAKQFCEWLNQNGGTQSSIYYRLPTDYEWSCATGLEGVENVMESSKSKNGKTKGRFPWGIEWPPLPHFGNYADTTAKEAFPKDFPIIPLYNDGFATTAPVTSFKANQYGLYDMGGNAWQWCDDDRQRSDRLKKIQGILRGASWCDYAPAWITLLKRSEVDPGFRSHTSGFRCVADEKVP